MSRVARQTLWTKSLGASIVFEMEAHQKKVGDALRTRRKAKQWSQEKAAQAVGDFAHSAGDRLRDTYGNVSGMARERYEMAEEYVEIVRQLFDSWEPGAIVADRKSGVLIDHTKVRTIDFKGKYYSSRGPLNSGPAPQGQPVIAPAGGIWLRR